MICEYNYNKIRGFVLAGRFIRNILKKKIKETRHWSTYYGDKDAVSESRKLTKEVVRLEKERLKIAELIYLAY